MRIILRCASEQVGRTVPRTSEPSLLGFSMTNETRQTAGDKNMKQLLHYLDLAMDPKILAVWRQLLTTLPLNYSEAWNTGLR
jgi:hypothetical protein